MNRIHRIRRSLAVLAGLACAMAGFGAAAPAALAVNPAPPGGGGPPVTQPALVRTVIVGGMPGWQITLIAAGAALLAAAVAVLLDRARAARRHTLAPTA